MSDMSEIIDELVVFKIEGGGFESNSPFWMDGRVRKAWIKKYGTEPEPEVEEDDEEVEDYSGKEWTNEALRIELSTRGLSVDGNKGDLVARLMEDDASEEE